MPHDLHNLYSGQPYSEDGRSYRDPDLAEYLAIEAIVGTRDLPGFSEERGDGFAGVTYKSHHFWVHRLAYKRDVERKGAEARASAALIVVRHGGGWEIWRGGYMLADALARYGDDDRGLFKLCWFLIDAAKSARGVGRSEATAEYRQAFVEGRLKKRKMPGRSSFKVWIDPPAKTEAAA